MFKYRNRLLRWLWGLASLKPALHADWLETRRKVTTALPFSKQGGGRIFLPQGPQSVSLRPSTHSMRPTWIREHPMFTQSLLIEMLIGWCSHLKIYVHRNI